MSLRGTKPGPHLARDKKRRGQCKAEHYVSGYIWYCVLDVDHKLPHVDDRQRMWLKGEPRDSLDTP